MSLVTLATAKSFLQISHSSQDTIIQILLDSCEEYLTKIYGFKLHAGSTEETEYLNGGDFSLWPTNLPLTGVTTILDRDSDDNEFTDDYRFNETRIFPESYERWGGGALRWSVKLDGGYTETTLPGTIKHAILNLVYRSYNSGRASDDAVNWAEFFTKGLLGMMNPYKFTRQIG